MTAEEALTFEGVALVFYLYTGRLCLLAADAGKALGYASDGKKLVDIIRDKWAADLIEGRDFAVLSGEDLRAFKGSQEDPLPGWVSSSARLMVLFESGWDAVCLKTEKPTGVRLRRLLVDKVLPKLRRGESAQLPAASTALALPAPAPAPMVVADPVALTAAILAAVRAMVEPLAGLPEQVESLHRRLDVVQKKQTEAALTSGVLTVEQVELVKADVRDLAATWATLGWAPTIIAAGRRIVHDLYQLAGLREGERHVHLIPAAAYGVILGRLARLRWEVRSYRARTAPRVVALPARR